MFGAIMRPMARTFDAIEHFWDNPTTQRWVAAHLFWMYLITLGLIECNRRGLLPESMAGILPTSHFTSIHLAFTLVLGMEVLELIFSIANSFSQSVGKQFEILALILLRNAFKELSNLSEPISIASNIEPILHIGLSAVGALLIFVCLGFYFRIIRDMTGRKSYITSRKYIERYILRKKTLAFFLLLIFIGTACCDIWKVITCGCECHFFETMYSLLIFSDIALVLLSQRYMPSFHAIFRNSGYVVGTLLMRLALSAGHPWDTAISIFAAVYTVMLSLAVKVFPQESMDGHKGNQ